MVLFVFGQPKEKNGYKLDAIVLKILLLQEIVRLIFGVKTKLVKLGIIRDKLP